MSDHLGKLSRLIDAAGSEDLMTLKLKILEERVMDLEDVVEDLCMLIDASSEDDETETDEEATHTHEIIITGKPAKKVASKKTKSTAKRTKTKKNNTNS